MYQVGDSVCHSVHGLGVIESVEEKQIQGQRMQFSVVAFERMKVMVSNDRAKDVLRSPVTADVADEILAHLGRPLDGAGTDPGGYAQQGHHATLKSGDIRRLADLIRALAVSVRDRKLTAQEKEVLREARAHLAQELAFVRKVQPEVMERQIDQAVGIG